MAGRPTRLTRKQKGFVEHYVATGNGTKSALEAYDVKNEHTAAVIASENLNKPEIAKAIQDALPEDMLAEKHLQLLNAAVVERINFEGGATDEEIQDVVARMPGYELLHIVRNKAGRGWSDLYAYVKAPDNMAQDKALDKAYKIKGSYAPEKSLGVLATVDLNHDHKERAKKLISGYLGGS